MADFNMIPCDRVISLIEDKLAGYAANGLLDTGKFYHQIAWFTSQLGLAVYELKDTMITFKDHKGELPCDFTSLDSAWLCHENHCDLTSDTTYNGKEIKPYPWKEFQDKIVIYTHKECDTINQAVSACNQATNGVVINACVKEDIVQKVTIKEYVMGNSWENWNSNYSFTPRLLKLGNKLTMNYCSKNCKNFRGGGVHDISIRKQGNTFYMYSNLKHPLIFIKYYAGPIDAETGLPLVPDHPIILQALEDYLTFFFFETLWADGQDVNLENKLKYWSDKYKLSLAEARYLSKLPSFNEMVESARRSRSKYYSWEVLYTQHV